MARHACVLLALTLALPSGAFGQSDRYRPSETVHEGEEVVAVVIGSSHCGFSTWPVYMAVIDPMLRSLQSQARARGLGFAAIGVAADEPADSGFAYLKRLADFDEIITGRTWFNTGLLHYVWPDSTIVPATPKLLLFARRFSDGVHSARMMTTRRLFVAEGTDSIMAFARRGAPLPALLPN